MAIGWNSHNIQADSDSVVQAVPAAGLVLEVRVVLVAVLYLVAKVVLKVDLEVPEADSAAQAVGSIHKVVVQEDLMAAVRESGIDMSFSK